VTGEAPGPGRRPSLDERPPRERIAVFLWLIGLILAVYALIIAVDERSGASAVRAVLLGALLIVAIRLRRRQGRRLRYAIILTAVAFVACLGAAIVGNSSLLLIVDGVATVLFVGLTIGLIGHALISWHRTDLSTVLGVLSAYLLLALFFAAVMEVCAAFQPHLLNGAAEPPNASDLLYFSVITICTVGFGDITPATGAARAVTTVEALVGQLYLVSVVAAVVSGWRAFDQVSDRPS
jgi:uncharacterized membrane protein